MEVDGVSEALAIAETACGTLEPLDRGVEAFDSGIGYARADGVEHSLEMSAKHAGDTLERLEAGANCPGIPGGEDLLCGFPASVVPHLHGEFLEHPGT